MEAYEATDDDWAVVDALWEILEKMPRGTARTIVTSAMTRSPEAVNAARNLLAEYGGAT